MGKGGTGAGDALDEAADDTAESNRLTCSRTAAADAGARPMVKPLEQRKAEFFAAMKRFNQLGALLPKPESLDAADAAGIAEAEMVLAEMRKVQDEISAMMEYERKLRDLQPGN